MFGTIRSANLCRVEPRIWFIGEKSYENKLSGGGEKSKFSESDNFRFFHFRESITKIQSMQP